MFVLKALNKLPHAQQIGLANGFNRFKEAALSVLKGEPEIRFAFPLNVLVNFQHNMRVVSEFLMKRTWKKSKKC